MSNPEPTTTAKMFDAEHGEFICVNGWLLFEDGAARELHPYGVRKFPPADPYSRTKKIVRFWEEKLALAVDEFTTFKQKLLNFTNTCRNRNVCSPPPDEGAVKRLRELQAKVKSFQERLKEAEVDMVKAKPEEMVRQENYNNLVRQQCESRLTEIKSIEI
ncbi:MAG: hypothetical protein JXB29_09410 [Sedimentisphaerales bacterium]|nr:hypothetical protein [Sedimentisphaerales bacterium]